MTRRLPITSQPLTNETLDSWVEYVAALVSPSVSDMFELIGLPKPWPKGTLARGVDAHVIAGLAEATGASPELLRRTTLQALDGVVAEQGYARINTVFLTGSRVRLCPNCLTAENRGWKLDWLLSVTHVCVHHKRILSERSARTSDEPSGIGRATRVGPRAIAAQRWIERILRSERCQIARELGRDTPSEPLMHDIAMITETVANKISFDEEKRMVLLFEREHTQATDIFNECWQRRRPSSMPPLWRRVISLTLIVEALTIDSDDSALALIAPIPVNTAQRFANSRPPSDNLRRLRSRPVRNFFLTHVVRKGSPTAHVWRNPTLVTAPGDPVPMQQLPGRLWAPILRNPPPCTDQSRPVMPTTLILALAGVGFIGDTVTFKRYFRWTVAVTTMQKHMSDLFDHENGAETLDYVLALRDHLLSNAAPINYERRRRTFRTHHHLLPTDRRPSLLEQMSARYIWQILTGGDPFLSAGTGTPYGLLASRYAEFVELLETSQRQLLARQANTILRRHDITDEPLMYSPSFGVQDEADGSTTFLIDDDPARFLLAGSYITESQIDSAMSIDEVIDRAFGETALSRSIHLVGRCASSVLEGKPIDHEQLQHAAAPIEELLGRTLYVRRHNGRFTRFNRTGESFVEAARAAGMI